MKKRNRVRGLLARKLEDPSFRRRFEEGYEGFELEVQILNALEAKGWTYAKLAEATHTSKSNISRDLSAGGILSARFSRINRIAEALGMKLVPLLIPKERARFITPQLKQVVRSSVLPVPRPSRRARYDLARERNPAVHVQSRLPPSH